MYASILILYVIPLHYTQNSYHYNFNRADFSGMRDWLSSFDWAADFDSTDVTSMWNCFANRFTEALHKFVPISKPRKYKSIFMTRDAYNLQKKKNRLWKRYCSSRSLADHISYIQARNTLRGLTRRLRCNYEKHLVDNMSCNPKGFWKYVNSQLKTRPAINEIQLPDGTIAQDDVQKAEAFNQFFTSIFTKEAPTHLPSLHIDHVVDPVGLPDISTELVCSMLHKLDSYKSPGPDGWPLWALKETAESICIPLSILYSRSLDTGILPDGWKRGHLTPVYKKGSRSSPNNYRPITLTSVIGKILESIIRDHILDHLIRYNLLSAQQHGFVPGKSCVSQLITAMDHWTQAYNSGYNTDCNILGSLITLRLTRHVFITSN